MRKDDPSSKRPRRRKSASVALHPALESSTHGSARPARKITRIVNAALDSDFGLALCLMPGLCSKRLPDA